MKTLAFSSIHKTISVWLVAGLFGGLVGCGSSSSGSGSAPSPTSQPGSSAKVIGPSGGSLASSDGTIQLSIPEGALADDTEIRIEVMAQGIEGGVGPSYSFSPDGLTFAIPAQLSLNTQAHPVNPSNVGLSFLDEQGHWRRYSETPSSELENAVSFDLPHFSQWSFYEQWYISPEQAEIYVGDSIDINVRYTACTEDSQDAECLLTPIVPNAVVDTWQVNGINNGNASVGTFTVASNSASGTYTAPGSLPSGNPVSIAANVDLTEENKGALQLTSNITVLPDAAWTGNITFNFAYNYTKPYIDGSKSGHLNYTARHDFSGVMTEALNDDGSGLVILELAEPQVQFEYGSTTTEHITGEDADHCVATRTTTTSLATPANAAELPPVSFTSYIQFNLDDANQASTYFTFPPAAMIQGEEKVRMEGCGLNSEIVTPHELEMILLEGLQSVTYSGQAEDGKHFTGSTIIPGGINIDGEEIVGNLTLSWTLQRND